MSLTLFPHPPNRPALREKLGRKSKAEVFLIIGYFFGLFPKIDLAKEKTTKKTDLFNLQLT